VSKHRDRHYRAGRSPHWRKIVEITNGIEAVQDGRIFIERVNEPFLAAGGSCPCRKLNLAGN
jgi:hypothetical protein